MLFFCSVFLRPAGVWAAPQVIDHRYVNPDNIPVNYLNTVRGYDVLLTRASVGLSLVDGLVALAAQNSSRYSLTIGDYPSTSWYKNNDGFGHWDGGKNGDPASKTANFVTKMSTYGSLINIAMMKFCYADNTLPASTIWESYRATMLNMEEEYPGVTFIWWTMPIKTTSDATRNSFNALVRNYAAANNKYLFDIADIESHDPDGNPVTQNGAEAMYAGYTTDGGHPNRPEGEVRLGGAYWGLMAVIAGWNPDGGATPTPIPTFVPVTGDIDGNGTVNQEDFRRVLSAWGNRHGVEDLDGNGEVNSADLAVVVKNWQL